MKFSKQISAGLVSFGLLVAASAQSQPAQNPVKFELPKVGADASQPAAADATAPAAPAAPKFTEMQLMEVYGYMMGARMGLSQLEFTPAQIDAMSKGLAEAASGKQPGYELQQIGPQLQEFLQKKEQTFMGKLRAQGMADTAAFLAKLKDNKAVQELPSGLRYEPVKVGTGASPKPGQLARINYKLSFIDGRVVEDSSQRGEPVDLVVQVPTQADPRGVIPGMAEGLQQMKVGGKARLYIPPHLAYGDEGNQGIPPASTLIFDVELVDVKDAPKDAAPAAAPAAGK